MNKRILRKSAGVLSALALAASMQAGGTVAAAAAPSGKPIVFATIVGTTGAYGATGQVIDAASKVAIKYLNDHGGLLGRPVKMLYYNDNAEATLSSEEFARALSAGAVAINGSSDTGPATAAEAMRYHIPDVGIVDDGGPTIYPNGFGTKPLSWVYEYSPDNYAIGEVFAKYALTHCKGGFALLHDTTSYGEGASQSIVATYKKAGQSLKVNDPITENWSTGATVSLTNEIDKIKSSGASCVDVWLTPQDEAAFDEAVHTLGYHFTVFGNDESYATDTYLQLAGKLANGTLSAMVTTQLHPTAAFKTFAKLYDAMWKQQPGIYQAATWDALMMVAKAIREKHSTSPSAIQEALNNMRNYPGAEGTIGFTAENHQTIGPSQLTLVRYNAGAKAWQPVAF